jgi:hypothetical protein
MTNSNSQYLALACDVSEGAIGRVNVTFRSLESEPCTMPYAG